MNGFANSLLNAQSAGMGGLTLRAAVMALLMAMVLGQVAAWAYVYTHTGLSYSRAFVQSIILLTLVVTLAMMVIGNNIVIAFGLVGALSVIRFRNILKDTRDTAFVFFALIAGMAIGTGRYQLAWIGTAAYCLVLFYLHWAAFGSRHTSDAFLRLQIQPDAARATLRSALDRHARSCQLVSQRFETSGIGEMAYRLTLRDPSRSHELMQELHALSGLSQITLVAHEDQDEV